MSRVLTVIVILLTLIPVVHANDGRLNNATLAGLPGVQVVVEDMDEDARACGVAKGDIQAMIELRLRQAGVAVLSRDERRNAPAQPYLQIVVTVLHQTPDPVFAYSVTVGVRQTVLLRTGKNGFGAETWGSRGLGAATNPGCAAAVRELVGKHVAKFVDAFVAANPRQ